MANPYGVAAGGSASASGMGYYGQSYSAQRDGAAATGTGGYGAYGANAAGAYPDRAIGYGGQSYPAPGYGGQPDASPTYGSPAPLLDRAAYLRARLRGF